ncbi:MAG TPA: outer membrane beta-barrel protein [Candidatus Acidoferrales bacterium]|jgi:hypothetical protein|nr:outer membrane beta-barrel protein [Candidatus Acidoferrales bacterium]
MKFNKWTLGLAAVGAVSMASAVRADEAKMSQLNTALSNTTISGVVDVGYNQQLGDVRTGDFHATRNSAHFFTPPYGIGNYSDGFTLNQLLISLDKPLDDSPWASGYHVDLNWGDSAVNYNNNTATSPSTGGAPIRQAYVTLRTPVGNGIDWKIGVQDGITGYEANTLSANPNYSRSYGWQVNPASLTGIIGTYKIIDAISVQAGLVNRNYIEAFAQSDAKLQERGYVFAAAFTAPDSFGFLKGSSLNLQTIQGFDNDSVDNYSASVSLATPVAGLRFGAVVDVVQSLAAHQDGNIWGFYGTYQQTDKLGYALRAEYINGSDFQFGTFTSGVQKHGEELTATVSYNLWANVLTRVEARWDHSENAAAFYSAGYHDAFLLAANVAYKF